MKKIVIPALMAICFLTGFEITGNLSGKWTGILKTDQGSQYPLLYDFKINGDELTGTAKTPKGELPINDGKISGDRFTFNVIMGKMEFDHSGKFYGDSVGVDISLGDAKSHATLKREQ